MAQDYARLTRPDWDRLGPAALALEIYNILNSAPITKTANTSDGFYIKAFESGSGSTFAVNFQAGGEGWDYGTVVSGSQTSYVVRLHGGNTITALVPRVLVNEKQSIPADAKCIVIRLSDNSYRLIAATWVVTT